MSYLSTHEKKCSSSMKTHNVHKIDEEQIKANKICFVNGFFQIPIKPTINCSLQTQPFNLKVLPYNINAAPISYKEKIVEFNLKEIKKLN